MTVRNSIFLFFPALLLAAAACNKWEDKPGPDAGLTKPYCNNPEAVNYNWDFPGIEDSTSCIFPTDPFSGTYSYVDSIYVNLEDTTALPGGTFTINLIPSSRKKMAMTGFCPSTTLFFTANRYFHADGDTVLGPNMQLMCRTEDTLSGSLDYSTADSSIRLRFTVVSDTGVSYHVGKAYKH